MNTIIALPILSSRLIKLFSIALLASFIIGCGASELNTSNKDKTPPVIKLVGLSEITLVDSKGYEDEGAIATDNIDGVLDVNVIRGETIQHSLGSYSYTITYSATDRANNRTSVTRQVILVDDVSPAI